MGKPLRVLMVEDSEDDVLLMVRALKKGGYDPVFVRVEDAGAMRKALQKKTWDVILCDYQMPQFNGLAAIALLKETGIDIPLIIVSGAIGEETAVECMRLGAHDYIMKGNLPRLVPAIERELKEAESRSKRRQAEEALRNSEARLRTILDATPFPIALVDLQDNIIDYWSHSALTLFGHTAPTTPEWYQIAYPDPDYQREVIDRWKPFLEIAHESGQPVNTGEYRVTCSDGSVRICELYATFLADRLIVTFSDITERKRAEAELVESKALIEAVVENVPLMIFLKEATDLRFVIFNRAGEELLGYDRRDLMGKNNLDLFPPEQAANFMAKDREVLDGEAGMLDIPEEPILTARKGERLLHTRKVCIRGSDGTTKFLLGISEDITERKRAEEELRESEGKYREIFESITDVFYRTDNEGTLLIVSPSVEQLLGYIPDEIIGRKLDESYINPQERDQFLSVLREKGVAKGFEAALRAKDGSVVFVSTNAQFNRDKQGKILGIQGVSRNITERRRMEDTLRKSEASYRQLFDNAPAGIYQVNFRTGKFIKANDFICEYLGFRQEEITSISPYDVMTTESRKLFTERLNKMAIGEKVPEDPEYEIVNRSGERRWLKLNVKYIYDSEGLAGADVVAHDITDRKRMDVELRESEELFRSYLENAPDGVYMSDLEGNFLYGNRKCEEIVGYKREELIGKNFLELNILSKNSLDKAIQVLQANSEGKSTGPDEVELISKEGRRIPLEINTNVLQRMGQRIVLSFVRDITERKQSEEKLQQTLENLRKAFIASIQLLVSAVEARDPYTAGHQIRSTNLARAIATEISLPQEKIEGLRMAGSIHDIGKLSIPAEILSKPTKLTNIEFSLIKEHARAGYEMLKDVESPWPLAEIVHQHHERIDGSGYPRQLKGDEILIEARIMAVADVVESMASHRPYRPAIGVEAALEEIKKNKGILYDDAVADACLRLFREKGFQL